MSKRDIILSHMREAGYHSDQQKWMRLYVENRIALLPARKAFAEGEAMRARGVPCDCFYCRNGRQR